MALISRITEQPEVGKTYEGRVVQIREGLGAIVEFLPKKSGLLHISQLEHHRVENVEDVLSVGERVEVKLVEVQDDGKFRLSRKALLPVPEGMEYREDTGRREGGGGGDRGRRDGGGGRGGYDRGPRSDNRGNREGGNRDRDRNGGGGRR